MMSPIKSLHSNESLLTSASDWCIRFDASSLETQLRCISTAALPLAFSISSGDDADDDDDDDVFVLFSVLVCVFVFLG